MAIRPPRSAEMFGKSGRLEAEMAGRAPGLGLEFTEV